MSISRELAEEVQNQLNKLGHRCTVGCRDEQGISPCAIESDFQEIEVNEKSKLEKRVKHTHINRDGVND